jgi:hypothetical protein
MSLGYNMDTTVLHDIRTPSQTGCYRDEDDKPWYRTCECPWCNKDCFAGVSKGLHTPAILVVSKHNCQHLVRWEPLEDEPELEDTGDHLCDTIWHFSRVKYVSTPVDRLDYKGQL